MAGHAFLTELFVQKTFGVNARVIKHRIVVVIVAVAFWSRRGCTPQRHVF